MNTMKPKFELRMNPGLNTQPCKLPKTNALKAEL